MKPTATLASLEAFSEILKDKNDGNRLVWEGLVNRYRAFVARGLCLDLHSQLSVVYRDLDCTGYHRAVEAADKALGTNSSGIAVSERIETAVTALAGACDAVAQLAEVLGEPAVGDDGHPAYPF